MQKNIDLGEPVSIAYIREYVFSETSTKLEIKNLFRIKQFLRNEIFIDQTNKTGGFFEVLFLLLLFFINFAIFSIKCDLKRFTCDTIHLVRSNSTKKEPH